MRANTPSVSALASNSYRASKVTFYCWQQSGLGGPATQGAWPNFGTKGSQVPQHLPSTTTNSHLSPLSAHIQSGQIISKSDYRCNVGNSLSNPLLKRPRSRWPPSRPCSFITGAACSRVCRISTSGSGSGRSLQDSASTPTASSFNFACGMMQRLRHAPEYLIITPKVESSPLPYTLQLLHNYYDEASNEKLSRLMTLFNGWLISNYKYANSDLCCHSILALEHFNALAHS